MPALRATLLNSSATSDSSLSLRWAIGLRLTSFTDVMPKKCYILLVVSIDITRKLRTRFMAQPRDWG